MWSAFGRSLLGGAAAGVRHAPRRQLLRLGRDRHVVLSEAEPGLRALAAPGSTAFCRDELMVPPLTSHTAAGAACGPPLAGFLGGVRGFYFPRARWWPWRARLMHQRQARDRARRHIWPRYSDPQEAPIFGDKNDGSQLMFRDKELKLGMRRMLDYCRLIKDKQIHDAIDWVECLGRFKSEIVAKLLRRALKESTENYGLDPARLFIYEAQPQRGYVIKSIRRHSRGRYGINKAPRNAFMVRVREMPLEEYFHRIFIYNKVPRSLSADMRLALHENRVSEQMMKEWAPYLCADSRLRHRIALKWVDATRQFDYYQTRSDWIQKYRANQMRATTEAREARGLPPLQVD
eukprot:TRINITY_DN81790_c0_g1_i1.p1 TRINITY_DN81790_c0_g1~~TRINITY_DN81790_c0_g1_i1.p1  ORF type:complete len:347 (-),score=67.37 TRINITY_DN81790_c0_g1_i1:32-1072(-)